MLDRLATIDPVADLLGRLGGRRYATLMADPPWRFQNSTGKVAPEHRRLSRYGTLTLDDIKALPVAEVAAPVAHLYLWVPNALLPKPSSARTKITMSLLVACGARTRA